MADLVLSRALSSTTDSVRADQGDPSEAPWPVRVVGSLVPVEYDEIALTYTTAGAIALAVYKLATVVVATVTLTYDDGGNLIHVART